MTNVLQCGVVVVGPRFIYEAKRPLTPTRWLRPSTHSCGFVCSFVFVTLILVFFLVYLSFIAYLFVYGNSLIVGSFICILAMMGEMYQVHQCVVLNLSLYLISKTICSTQVQLSSLGMAQVGAGIFGLFRPEIPVGAESPPPGRSLRP